MRGGIPVQVVLLSNSLGIERALAWLEALRKTLNDSIKRRTEEEVQ
jgi:hypothetical protein